MAMFCQFCNDRMTSAPSHMDHERECSKNPAVALEDALDLIGEAVTRTGGDGRILRKHTLALGEFLHKHRGAGKEGK